MSVEHLSLSDAQKLELRPALARVHGALMRAWQLGMFVPADEADRELLRNARKLLVMPERPPEQVVTGVGTGPAPRAYRQWPDPGADAALEPLSDADYLVVFDGLFDRFRALADAYRRTVAVDV